MAFRLPLLGDLTVQLAKPDAEVQAALNRRFQLSNGFSLYGIFPFVAILTVMSWNRSDRVGLLTWAAIMTVVATLWLRQIAKPVDESWIKKCSPYQVAGALSWSLFPLLAMPEDEVSQIAVVACLSGVIAANTNSASPLMSMFYRFHITLCAATAVGLVVNANGAALWTGLPLLGFFFVYAAVMAEINHRTHREAAEFGVKSRRLAKGLESKQVQLEKANAQLDHQARTDPLTGVTNRLGLDEALADAFDSLDQGSASCVGLVFIDLDDFKLVNDTLGHLAGDQLLIAVASRLAGITRPNEILARRGGDELVLLSKNLRASDDRENVTDDLRQRICDVFGEPFAVQREVLHVSASCGIAFADSTMTPDDLLRQADSAAYEAKAVEGTNLVAANVAPRDERSQPLSRPRRQ